MNILHISNVSSQSEYRRMYEEAPVKPWAVTQKYYSLLLQGLSNEQEAEITVISSRLVNRKSLKHFIYKYLHERENGIDYHYLPFVNIVILRQLFLIIFSFIFTLKWCRTKPRGIVMFNILDVYTAIGAFAASKISGNKTLGIVTDLPDYSFGKRPDKLNLEQIIKAGVENFILYRFDSFVFLTKYMEEKINGYKKPCVIVEGFVDSNISCKAKSVLHNSGKRICLYSGGLKKIYGVEMLVNAFQKIDSNKCELHLYGNGDYVEELKRITSNDQRIKYFGNVGNEIVIERQKEADILLNPRLSAGEYTKHSFPSKILEYMISGTPVLTTRLPGIPDEYWQYLYIFDDESEEGFRKTLKSILDLPEQELNIMGYNAKRFVIKHKNSINQTRKIIKIIKNMQ